MSKQEKLSWAIAAVLVATFLFLVVVGFATGQINLPGQIRVIERLSSGGYEDE